MTIEDLIAILEELPGDAEVRLAMQPGWPLAYAIGGVSEALPPDAHEAGRCSAGRRIVYISEGANLGYLPEAAARALGWSGKR
jgi:hypothetical protein